MKPKILSLLLGIALVGLSLFLATSGPAVAQTLQDQILDQATVGARGAALGGHVDPRLILAQTVQIFLGLLAIIFLFLILLSGYWLVTARGDSTKEENAKSTIRRAIIGFTIVILAYGITVIASRVIIGSVAGIIE